MLTDHTNQSALKATSAAPCRLLLVRCLCLIGILLCAGCANSPEPGNASAARRLNKTTCDAPVGDNHRSAGDHTLTDCVRRAQQHLDVYCAAHKCPGATLGFVLKDGRSGAVATGVSNKSSKRPMRPTDRMFSGSIGKTYVAAVLMQLVEEGRVDLNAKITRWFGDDVWFARLPNAPDLTLRMLMNHTSGIPRHLYVPEMQAEIKAHPQKVWRPEELIAFVLDREPLFPTAEGWSYADTNYILVGMIIERVTRRAYYQELTDRILRPLELQETIPADRPDLPGLISGYSSENNIFSLPVEVARDGRYAMNPQVEWTGGGLVSTSLDLARWAWMLYGGDVLKAESLRRMCEGVPMKGGLNGEYGLGVMMRYSEHGPVMGHAGWVPGYVSLMAYYQKHGVSVAVQVNGDVGIGISPLQTLLDDVAGELVKN